MVSRSTRGRNDNRSAIQRPDAAEDVGIKILHAEGRELENRGGSSLPRKNMRAATEKVNPPTPTGAEGSIHLNVFLSILTTNATRSDVNKK